MPAAKSNSTKRPPRKKPAAKKTAPGSSVSRNVGAARDRLVERVSSSLNMVLLTRKNIEEVIDDAVRRGRMTQKDAHEMIQTLLQRGARATTDVVSDLERLIGRGGQLPDQPAVEAEPGLPIAGYDDLSAAKVQERLSGLTPADLRKVRDYEKRHANRKTVLDAVERKLK